MNKQAIFRKYSTWCITILVFLSQIENLEAQVIGRQNSNQIRFKRIETGMSVSPNAHGPLYNVGFSIQKNRHVIGIQPLIQLCSNFMKGLRANYSFVLFGKDYPTLLSSEEENHSYNFGTAYVDNKPYSSCFQLSAFSFVQYLHKLPMASGYIKDEIKVSRGNDINWSQVNLSTLEFGVGFEFKFQINERLSIKNFLATSFVYHTNYKSNMYHEKSFCSVMIGTSLEFTLSQ